jgi:periplasmic divalent cation tolerance protein
MAMGETIFLYTTWPDAETARAAGEAAVDQGLAACANVHAPMSSIYRWKGAVERADETPMTLKTTAQRAGALRDLIAARHPYELPCILALPVNAAASNPAFLAWIAAETSPPGEA